jgi:ubiquinone/menaquinone biosynthesis C-methylase UbiE
MQRRNQAEAMDAPDLDPALLADDLRNLEILNRFFAGRSVVRRHLARVLGGAETARALSVVDVGSGAGDLCRVVVEECRRAGHPVRVVSLDAHAQIQAYARDQLRASYPEVRFLQGDARRMPLRDCSVDVTLCTLALHHFAEEDAVRVLSEMRRVTRNWAIVSDLCRSPHAYAGVWLATRLMPNPMTRHDGPVSVQRAFTAAELRDLAELAGWSGARICPEPWFRMSLVFRRGAPW